MAAMPPRLSGVHINIVNHINNRAGSPFERVPKQTLNKMRGEARWTGWLFTSTGFVRDMLVLLSHGRDVFLALHERRSGRTRWIQGLSLQTNDPADE
jgi:hypothetical protein